MQRLLDATAEGLKLTFQGSTLSRIRNTKRELHTPLCVCIVQYFTGLRHPNLVFCYWSGRMDRQCPCPSVFRQEERGHALVMHVPPATCISGRI